MITPQEFVARWQNANLNERQAAQLHFADVCNLIGHPPPTGVSPDGKEFTFEKGIQKDSGGQGYADVYYEGHFAIEYKAKGKDLTAAYQQLKQYRENLKNPPLLVVCDIHTWEIHTNFTNSESKVYRFTNQTVPQNLKIIRALFEDPERLHPGRTTEQVTVEAAASFKAIVDEMRDEWKADPERIAHFMTRLVFCLFAEDIELLPQMQQHGIFSHIVEETRMDKDASRFERYMRELFQAMADGGDVFMKSIRYFNGSLFEDVLVEPLSASARSKLADACRLNWASVEPAIFGTLFERSLDPAKRAQLGAHYTSRDDILLIVEPVLMQPLHREWERIKQAAAPIRAIFDKPENPRARTAAHNQLIALREQMLSRLRSIKVLDPACGSGNFLYVSLGLLLDLEKEVINHPLWAGLTQPLPEVHPRQLYGIEKDEIAHALASIVVWIGYIQWKQNNGYLTFHEPILENLEGNIRKMDAILAFDEHGNPIEPDWPEVDVIVGNPPFLGGSLIRGELGNDYIEKLWQLYQGRIPGFSDLVCYWFDRARAQIEHGKAKRAGLLATNSIRGGVNREVLKRIKESGNIFMAWADREWTLDGAAVRVSMVGFDKGEEKDIRLDNLPVEIINPDLTANIDITEARCLRENLGICFIGAKKAGAFDIDDKTAQAMLTSANSSGHANSDVIFPWINGERIVKRLPARWIISFGEMEQQEAELYEKPFDYVRENVYPERQKNNEARARIKWWLHRRPAMDMQQAVAKLNRYIATPRVSKYRLFVWVSSKTLPDDGTYIFARDDDYFFGVLHSKIHEVWSLRMGTWLGKGNDPRYTPTTTFETFPFPWPPTHEPASDSVGADVKDGAVHPGISETPDSPSVIRPGSLSTSDAPVDTPDSRPGVFLPSDSVGAGAKDGATDSGTSETRYSPSVTRPGSLSTSDAPVDAPDSRPGVFPALDSSPAAPDSLYHAIAHAARRLHDERHAWLNPPHIPESKRKDRTLTNLYNALNVYRGKEKIAVKKDAGDFAPRLDELHRALDAAVCAAYGWDPAILDDEEAILRELLTLNLQRAE